MYSPISRSVLQYSKDGDELAAGYWLKAYEAGTTTNLPMGTDSTGTTTLAKAKLNTAGYPLSNSADDTSIFIPFFNQDYKLALYATEADADADTNAVWMVDNVPNEAVDTLNYTPGYTGGTTITLQSALDLGVKTVTRFGAVGDGSTDDAAAFQAAIDSGGVVYVPAFDTSGNRLNYMLGSPIVYPDATSSYNPGPTGFVGLGGRPEVTATHTSGPVFRLRYNRQTLQEIMVNADATRQAAAATTNNHGVSLSSDDIVSGANDRIQHGYLLNVFVYNQPAMGFLFEEDLVSTYVVGCEADECGSHGMLIERGDQSGRTNKTRPGIMSFQNCRASDCGGHALMLGYPGNGANHPYRIFIHNFENFRCATDAAIRQTNSNVYCTGDNITFESCAFGGNDLRECIFVAGQNIVMRNCRFVNSELTTAVRVGDGDTGAPTTKGIWITEPHFTQTGTLADAVLREGSARSIHVQADVTTTQYTNLTNMESGFVTHQLESNDDGNRLWFGQLQLPYFDSGLEISLDDDEAKKIPFSADTRGMMTVNPNSELRGQAVIVTFRVTSNMRCDILAQAAVSGGATTAVFGTHATYGALTGTSGTDGNLTVSVHTDGYLYIENRTNASGTYTINFLSVDGGRRTGAEEDV